MPDLLQRQAAQPGIPGRRRRTPGDGADVGVDRRRARHHLQLLIHLLSRHAEMTMHTDDPQAAAGTAAQDLLVDPVALREQVRGKYREVAVDPGASFHFHTGRDLASRLAYEAAAVDALPSRAVESFAGV